MVYKINVPLVGGDGTRKKEIIDANNNLTVDEIRARILAQVTQAQGTVSGYSSGSTSNPSPSILNDTIEKFPFSTDANATDVGNLTLGRSRLSGASSTSHGYTAGGSGNPYENFYNNIDKFSFSVDGNASDVGDLTESRYDNTGQSSTVSGYSSGGENVFPPVSTNVIDKFSFASDANATDVGDLTQPRTVSAGQSSTTHGYTSGSSALVLPGTGGNVIDKFPFSSDANATDVGDLTQSRGGSGGNSSSTHGYSGGGSPGFSNVIDKFSFSSDGDATDVGDITVSRGSVSEGQNSTSSGYLSGGFTPAGPGAINVIEKYPFSTDANATDVGDLTVNKSLASGQQV